MPLPTSRVGGSCTSTPGRRVSSSPTGRRARTRLAELASECDVVVTDRREHLALGDLDDATTVVVITPFGLTGPYAELPRPPSADVPCRRRGIDPAERRGLEALSRAASGPDRERHRGVRRGVERGGRGPRRLLRPPADRSGAAHRHLGAGVGAHAEPHPPQPLQQRRRHAPPRRQPLRILRDDRVSRRLGAAGRAHTRSVGRARGLGRRGRARRSARSPPRPRAPPTWPRAPPRCSRGVGRATRPTSCAS